MRSRASVTASRSTFCRPHASYVCYEFAVLVFGETRVAFGIYNCSVRMITVLTAVAIFASLRCGVSYAQNSAESDATPPEVVYYDQEDNAVPQELPLANVNPSLDQELGRLSEALVQVLEHSWGPGGVPMLYVEERADAGQLLPEGASNTPWKRSRYYRRYPWKRQNSRSRTYEADNRYMCQPTREDVFKLLVALHETRAGNGGKSINFCNRRRSAGAIFTNIRFLGRK